MTQLLRYEEIEFDGNHTQEAILSIIGRSEVGYEHR